MDGLDPILLAFIDGGRQDHRDISPGITVLDLFADIKPIDFREHGGKKHDVWFLTLKFFQSRFPIQHGNNLKPFILKDFFQVLQLAGIVIGYQNLLLEHSTPSPGLNFGEF